MFYGSYEHKVDDKGRVPIPARFRREVKEELALTHLSDRCITAYPAEEWEKIGKNLTASASPDRMKTRLIKRMIFGRAFTATFDAQGRVMLPAMLREGVGIKESALIVGAGNYFEIWDKDSYETTMKPELESEAFTLIESLGS